MSTDKKKIERMSRASWPVIFVRELPAGGGPENHNFRVRQGQCEDLIAKLRGEMQKR